MPGFWLRAVTEQELRDLAESRRSPWRLIWPREPGRKQSPSKRRSRSLELQRANNGGNEMYSSHAVILVIVVAFFAGNQAAATALCESTGDQSACGMNTDHQPHFAQLVPGGGVGAPAPKQGARPLEPLCRDYKELTDRRALVDRQQIALLPKFQMLEEVCLTEGRPPTMSNYACTLPSGKFVRGSCCIGIWDCLNNYQATCDAMENFCKGLGAAWSRE